MIFSVVFFSPLNRGLIKGSGDLVIKEDLLSYWSLSFEKR